MYQDKHEFIDDIAQGKWFKIKDRWNDVLCKFQYDKERDILTELCLCVKDPELMGFREYSPENWYISEGTLYTLGSWRYHFGDDKEMYDDNGNVIFDKMVHLILDAYEATITNIVDEDEIRQVWGELNTGDIRKYDMLEIA